MLEEIPAENKECGRCDRDVTEVGYPMGVLFFTITSPIREDPLTLLLCEECGTDFSLWVSRNDPSLIAEVDQFRAAVKDWKQS